MKKIAKKIMVLLVMMIAMLALGISSVSAASLPTNNGIVKGSKLQKGTSYEIDMNDYDNNKNLHCAQPKYKLSHWVKQTYKLVHHVHLEGNVAHDVDLSTKKIITKSKVTSRL